MSDPHCWNCSAAPNSAEEVFVVEGELLTMWSCPKCSDRWTECVNEQDHELGEVKRALAALESSARECALALASKAEEAARLAAEVTAVRDRTVAYYETLLAAKTEEAERLREALARVLNNYDESGQRFIGSAELRAARLALSSPESAPAPDAGAASGPCRCTGIGPNPSHKPPCAPAPDADEPLDGWPCVECGRAGEACVCGPCGVLGCRNYSPCPVHDTDAHARDVRRLDERDRVVGAPRAPAPESAETAANSSSKETDR